jgi:Rrf2 family protein
MGLHVLAFLSWEPQEFFTSQKIAESTLTNPVVVRRIASRLQVAGLVETQKGRGGGMRLAKPAETITMAEIYRAVETAEPLHLPHTEPNPACPVGSAMKDILSGIFARAESAMQSELEKTLLSEVVATLKAAFVAASDQK